MTSWAFSEAALDVDSCPFWLQVCAAGGDWAGLGPRISQVRNSLSLFVSLWRKRVHAWLFAPCKQQSPALRFLSVCVTLCQCHHRSLCHPPAEGWELCRARGTSPLEKLLCIVELQKCCVSKEWFEGLKRQNR